MFKSFFIAAVRNLRKNRLYTAINVLGLALGVACCLVIFVIVKYETSFDDYHQKADRIYRVNFNQQTPEGGRILEVRNYSPLAEAIRQEVSGLEAVTGVYCLEAYQFSKDENLFEEKFAFFADGNYGDVFDLTWLAGNREMALDEPNSAVVTDSFAEKFLGGVSHAIGSTFTLENRLTLTVSGIVQTPPSNTDHPFSILVSYSSLAEFLPQTIDNWETIGGSTYVVFDPETKDDQIYPQLTNIIHKYLRADVAARTEFHLMPLNDNHDRNYDYSSYNYDFPMPVMVILSIIAGMIAFIACINYVNLATAQSLRRAREVGLRKTMGGSRVHLVVQYMCEAFVITLLAVLTGMALAQIAMLRLNELYGGNYLRFDLLRDPFTLVFILGITILVSVLAGFYPAFVLSGYRPVVALRAQNSTGKSKGISMRRALVILQFAGAQILILVTIIMINQISYFKDRPIGYDPQTVVLLQHLRGNENQQHDRLRHELENVSGIVTCSFGDAGNDRSDFYRQPQYKHAAIVSYADTNYIHAFNFELLAGTNLAVGGASSQVLVNESLIKALGFENAGSAIGAIFTLDEKEVVIEGVLGDTYTNPMSSKVDPVALLYDPAKFTSVAVRISTDQVAETLAGIEHAWKIVYPDYLCKYIFMDDLLARQYGFYNIIFSVLGTGSFLAIFIGCLGLYGLVSFMAVQRTREIGIRKVLGATVSNIMMLFTKESAILIAIAFAFAAPLAHMTAIAMLIEFPERVPPGFLVFLITLLVSLLIALFTVAYRSFRAAVQNPVNSLRTE